MGGFVMKIENVCTVCYTFILFYFFTESVMKVIEYTERTQESQVWS